MTARERERELFMRANQKRDGGREEGERERAMARGDSERELKTLLFSIFEREREGRGPLSPARVPNLAAHKNKNVIDFIHLLLRTKKKKREKRWREREREKKKKRGRKRRGSSLLLHSKTLRRFSKSQQQPSPPCRLPPRHLPRLQDRQHNHDRDDDEGAERAAHQPARPLLRSLRFNEVRHARLDVVSRAADLRLRGGGKKEERKREKKREVQRRTERECVCERERGWKNFKKQKNTRLKNQTNLDRVEHLSLRIDQHSHVEEDLVQI